MYIVRDIFNTKPGKAKELVSIFKKAAPLMGSLGIKDYRILTDSVSTYWTVVIEFEVENISDYFDLPEGRKSNKELEVAMQGYMDLVLGGHREIFKVE
jgi:hypothetical protein